MGGAIRGPNREKLSKSLYAFILKNQQWKCQASSVYGFKEIMIQSLKLAAVVKIKKQFFLRTRNGNCILHEEAVTIQFFTI